MKKLLVLGGGLAAFVLALGLAALTWVPSDKVGVSGGDAAPRALSPGLHFRIPFSASPVLYPIDLGPVDGTAPLRLADGTMVQVTFDISARLDPARVVEFHEVAAEFGVEHVLRQGAAHGIAAAAATHPPSDLPKGAVDADAVAEASRLLQSLGVGDVHLGMRVDSPESILKLARALAPQRLASLVKPIALAAVSGAHGGSWEAHTALGLAKEAEHDLRGAEASYLDALSLQPAAVPPMAELVQLYTTVKEYDKIERLLIAALEARPQSVDHLNWLAGIYMKTGELEKAETLFLRALESRPEDTVILNNLGGVYLMHGRGDEAIEMFRRAVAAAPADRPSLYNLGVALSSRGDHEEAVGYLLEAEKVDPGRKAVREALAQAYRGLGKRAEADRWRRRAAEAPGEGRPAGS